MKFLRSLLAGLFTGAMAQAADPAAAKAGADMMRELRLMWLTKLPQPDASKNKDTVVAVVMDWPLGDNIVTVLSSAEGDASLYTTSTFGVLGGIGHEKVRKAAREFVKCGQHFLPLTSPTTEFPYPDKQTLRIYLVTYGGVRTVSFPMTEIERKDSPARILYYYGDCVITELRLVTPDQKPK